MFSFETQCFQTKMYICYTYCIKQQHFKDMNEPTMSTNLNVDRSFYRCHPFNDYYHAIACFLLQY